MKNIFLLVCLFLTQVANAQKSVAITIDDVPNSVLYNEEGFRCRLLEKIDSLHLPAAIFINERLLFSTDSVSQNIRLFNNWVKNSNITLGNHAFNHAMYSTINLDSFITEVLKGEAITKQLALKQNKTEKYFRFPYNDLGKDETQQKEATDFLNKRNYIITPFTVHSDDWLARQIYTYYKTHNRPADAERIAKAFIKKTLDYFDYIETLTSKKAGRDVKQIYLMHDNLLNADYLPQLIDALKEKGYHFISLDEAMTDPVYQQEDYFKERFGISWVYRWIKDKTERNELINKGPQTTDFEKELKEIQSAGNK